MHELMNTTKEVFGKIEKNGEQGQAAKNQAQENLKYDFWLASLLYIDSRKRIRVREMCGSAQAVYELKEETLKNMYLFTDTELQYLLESRKKDLNRIWECFLAKNMRLIPYSSRAYPDKLTHIAQPPYAIFCKGAMPDARKSVGIVGARMCSEYGRSIATKLGKLLADKDVQVISGMALGIDSASHAGALQGKGSTFAVLGCGCDVCYPKNARNLYENIQSSGGGILSEYPPGTLPHSRLFPPRNRIISALSDLVLVIEAREKSGTLITVDMALEQGKDVFAVPGRITDTCSRGCNRLIGNGAGIAVSVAQLLQELQGSVPHAGRDEAFSLTQAERPNAANAAGVIADKMLCPVTDALSATASSSWPPLRKTIWQALDTMPQSMDEIADTLVRQKISINVQMLMQELVFLELEGAAGSVMGRYYRKTFACNDG